MSIREFVVGPGDGQLVGSNPWFERVPKGKQCLGQVKSIFCQALLFWLFGCSCRVYGLVCPRPAVLGSSTAVIAIRTVLVLSTSFHPSGTQLTGIQVHMYLVGMNSLVVRRKSARRTFSCRI